MAFPWRLFLKLRQSENHSDSAVYVRGFFHLAPTVLPFDKVETEDASKTTERRAARWDAFCQQAFTNRSAWRFLRHCQEEAVGSFAYRTGLRQMQGKREPVAVNL